MENCESTMAQLASMGWPGVVLALGAMVLIGFAVWAVTR